MTPAIPDSNFAAEPAPNGSRINLGHFGGTSQADTSGNQRVLRLLAPNGGEILFRRGVGALGGHGAVGYERHGED